MPSILVATGFVRIDADARPATKALKAFGAIGSAALTSTIAPAAAAASAALLSVASSAAAAGGAAAVFGAAVIPQFKAITEASQKQATAEDAKTKATVASSEAQKLAKKYGYEYGQQVKITSKMSAEAREHAKQYNSALSSSQSASKSATMAQAIYNEKLAAMTPATRKTALAFEGLKDDFQNWSDGLSSSTMPIFTRGIEFLRKLLPKLTPLVRNVSKEINSFVTSLGEGVAGKTFREFGKNVSANGAGALGGFLAVVRNITVGFVGLLNTFMPMSKSVNGGLVSLTQRFAEWGATSKDSPGLQKMMQMAKDSVPSFVALAQAIGDVASAAGPLSGIGLKVLTLFAQLVSATPTPVLRLIVPVILAVNLGLKLYAIYTAAATAATWLFTTSVTASSGTLYTSRAVMIVHRIALIATAVATAATTAATWLWTAATTAASLAMTVLRGVLLGLRYALVVVRLAAALTTLGFRLLAIAIISNPIALAITALIALGLVFVLLWKKSETFRTIVIGAWDGIKTAALIVGQWFAGPFAQFFIDGWGKIMKYVINPIVWFFTKGIPAAAGAMMTAVVSSWTGLYTGVLATYNFLKTKVFNPLITFFTVYVPNGALNARNRVVGWWVSLRDGVAGVYASLRDRIFSPIGTFFTKTIPNWAKDMSNKVKGFFTSMRDGIGTIWQGIQNKAKAPINWVIDHVWNRGIVSVWGKIAGWIGLGNKLKTIKLLEAGGTVGRAQPGVFNKPTAIVGEGNSRYPEYVIPTDPKYATRARGLWNAAGAHFMEDGGILGSIGGAVRSAAGKVTGVVKGAVDFLSDPLGNAKKLLTHSLSGLSSIGSSDWAQAIAKLPRMAVDGLLKAVKSVGSDLIGAVGLGSGGNGGSGVSRWRGIVQLMLQSLGQPAAYTDLTLRRMNQESGGNPTIVNKWDSNWQAGHPSVGLMQVIGPTFRSYAGKYRSTGPFLYGVSTNPAANIYSSMRYALSAYGSLPRAYNRAGGYANGTAGTTTGMHLFGENGPELGFSPAGWRILNTRRTAALAGGGGVHIDHLTVENHGVIGSREETLDWLVEATDQLRRRGRL